MSSCTNMFSCARKPFHRRNSLITSRGTLWQTLTIAAQGSLTPSGLFDKEIKKEQM